MKKIVPQNIESYLLYLNRHLDSQFDSETIERWKNIPAMELDQYLQRLYHSLGMDLAQAQRLEQGFLNPTVHEHQAQAARPSMRRNNTVVLEEPAPTSPTSAEPNVSGQFSSASSPQGKPHSTRNIFLPLIFLALLVIAGILLYPQLNTKETADEPRPTPQETPLVHSNMEDTLMEDTLMEDTLVMDASTENTESPEQVTTPSTQTSQSAQNVESDDRLSEDVIQATESGDFDKGRAMSNLRGLVRAEDDHDASRAMQFYSLNMTKYWDMNNPSKSAIRQRYDRSFKKLKESKNEFLTTEWVGPRTVESVIKFTYTGANTGETKSVVTRMRYEFDENGLVKKAEPVR